MLRLLCRAKIRAKEQQKQRGNDDLSSKNVTKFAVYFQEGPRNQGCIHTSESTPGRYQLTATFGSKMLKGEPEKEKKIERKWTQEENERILKFKWGNVYKWGKNKGSRVHEE